MTAVPKARRQQSLPFSACVIGSPVKHSLSPVIFSHWFEQTGLNKRHSYEALEVESADLMPQITSFQEDMNFRGFNVTIPHKQTVMNFCKHVDAMAERIGAVNAVTFDTRRNLYGVNTDAYGFIEGVRHTVPHIAFSKRPALILGAGGAARAVLEGLLAEGTPEITLCNRTLDKAATWARTCSQPDKVKVLNWKERNKAVEDCSLLVNTTSLGMEGQEPLDLSLKKIKTSTVVCDIVYSPLVTPLLANAEKQNCRTVNGLGMLVHQAHKAFQIWFGVLPDITPELWQKLEAAQK